MKTPLQTALRFLPLAFSLWFGAALSAQGQTARIDMTPLNSLSPKASQTVDISIDEPLLKLAIRFLSNKDDDEVRVREVLNGLKGIYVRSFEFEKEGEYSQADVDSIRSQLQTPTWFRIVGVISKKDGNVEVHLMTSGDQVGGLAVLVTDAKEFTVVNLVGPIDLEKLSALEGQFGIPELELSAPKPKPKK